MKKWFVLFNLIMAFQFPTMAQSYDDGLVSDRLAVNTGEAKFVSFVTQFRSGINKVRARELTSVDAIASFYEVDLRSYPRLSQLATTGFQNNSGEFSPAFVTMLKNAIDRLSYEDENVGALRNDLLNIAVTHAPTSKESEALAVFDIAVQEITKEFLAHDVTYNSFVNPGQDIQSAGINPVSTENCTPIPINEIKLPRWIKCGLGVIGSAILGGLSGARGGAAVGVVFGAGGAAVGAVVGGIAGVIGGAFTGAASFCD